MAELVVWIAFGILAAWILSCITEHQSERQNLLHIAAGVTASVIGGLVGRNFISGPATDGTGLSSTLIAVMFAVMILIVIRHKQSTK